VVVVVAIITSSSADCTRRHLMSPITSLETSSRRPIAQRSSPVIALRVRGAAGQPRLVHERAVAHRDQSVGGRRDPGVVGHDHERLAVGVKLIEQAQQIGCGGAVEIARWFVGEQNQRLVRQRPRDRHALALSAGKR